MTTSMSLPILTLLPSGGSREACDIMADGIEYLTTSLATQWLNSIDECDVPPCMCAEISL